jgi:HEPN domain-containing protein
VTVSALEWIATADTDLDMLRRALVPPENTRSGAYHAQQAAEKLIKALLVHRAIPFPTFGNKGHDLGL